MSTHSMHNRMFLGILVSIAILLIGGCAETHQKLRRSENPSQDAPYIFYEFDAIIAYCEVQNLKEYSKLVPPIFDVPERPLCRVYVKDFYHMKSGPPYLEASIAILVKWARRLGWYTLTMPVTSEDACWKGKKYLGFPKIVRKIKLEWEGNRYVGKVYSEDGRGVDFQLTLRPKFRLLGIKERKFLDYVSPIPTFSPVKDWIREFRPIGGGKYSIPDLNRIAPHIWSVKFGECILKFSKNKKHLLNTLEVGRVITGYWVKQTWEFTL